MCFGLAALTALALIDFLQTERDLACRSLVPLIRAATPPLYCTDVTDTITALGPSVKQALT